MAVNKYLFKLVNDNLTDSPGLKLGSSSAPTLLPINSNGQLIDVVGKFPWTSTVGSDSARKDVPRITLKEFNVTRSSMYQQARYLLGSLPDITQALQQGINNVGAGKVIIASTIGGALAAGTGKKLVGAAAGALAAITADSNLPTAIANKAVQAASKAGLTDTPNTNLKNYLKPYDNLYATKATGFSYSMPFFNTEWKQGSTSWDALQPQTFNKFDSALKDISTSILGGGVAGATGIGSLGSVFPCSYSEVPKAFKYTDGSQNKININFQLFNNTGDINDVVANWQLCFLLMYQNMPNRSSRVLVDVPCIYSANVDGVLYMPYAFISRITINQLGATRKMILPISVSSGQDFAQRVVQTSSGNIQANVRPPAGETSSSVTESSIETQIPDVFEISIELTSLVAETKNLLYQTLTTNKDIYDVSVLPSTQP